MIKFNKYLFNFNWEILFNHGLLRVPTPSHAATDAQRGKKYSLKL